MCTAITYKTKDFYFGRNLDYELSYGEKIVITPRNYPFKFRHRDELQTHFAIIGMAAISNNYPLYYDAMNEKGLCIAGLLFPNNAKYYPLSDNSENITPFELIPLLLGTCKNVDEAQAVLNRINLANTNFSKELPLTPLHWLISDKNKSVTTEPLADGLKICENPIGVLTNNPPFEIQMYNLNNYLSLTSKEPQNRFSDKITLSPFSRGMGAIGLPGDLSSQSRFVKATFTKLNSVSGDSEAESISQFFHILKCAEQQRGSVELKENKYEITIYSSCCNADKGIYYYTTYENNQINAVCMMNEDLDKFKLIEFPLKYTQNVNYHN